MVLDVYAPLIHGRAKVAQQEHCRITDLLGPDLESAHLEYNATLRTHAGSGAKYTPLDLFQIQLGDSITASMGAA